jgi:hypothetical protein
MVTSKTVAPGQPRTTALTLPVDPENRGDAMSPECDETFRGTMRGRTPEGDYSTVIVLRRGLGLSARVWLTFNGAIKTTVVMTEPETEELVGLLGDAQRARSVS